MDIGDKAAEIEQLERDSNLFLAQRRRSARLEPRGACYYCETKVSGIFCDLDCSQGWEKEAAAKRRNHGNGAED